VNYQRQELHCHVRQRGHLDEASHLASHHPGRSRQPAERSFIDEEPSTHLPGEQPALPLREDPVSFTGDTLSRRTLPPFDP
jgi:hypothetical protein